MKIKHQLFLTHGLLVVLALIIVLINVFAYKTMDSDASLINKSGKLRALSYNMAQLSNQINNHNLKNEIYNTNLSSLQNKIDEFDSILLMLSENKTPLVPDLRYNQAIEKFKNIAKVWNEEFKPSYLKIVDNEISDTLCTQINNRIDSYVNDINEMVNSYSLYAREKVIKALYMNAGLLFLIIIVTLYSFTSTNKKIQKPMKTLMHELKELSLFDEEFSKKIKAIKTDEISEMTKYFNEMMYDELTNTFNRRSGLAKLSKMLQYDNRRHLEMSLCFIDVNGLKMVNDQLGHKFGDELIVSAIDCVKQEIRDEDFIIRMGGDEFLIVFKNINEELSENIWSRINNRYKIINEQENRAYIISVSHGIVEYDNLEKSEIELLIKNADDKMYLEKKHIKEELKIKIIK